MKKWIIGLFIIALIGLTSSAALAGHIYFNEMQVYEDQKSIKLDPMALDNIYINSALPVSIEVAEGEPYAVFIQKFVDVTGNHPTYTLSTESKGNFSSIILNEEKSSEINFLVKENWGKCTIYLPQKTINDLKIQTDEKLDMNLIDMDITHLTALFNQGSIHLKGKYDKLKLNGNYGEVEIDSKSCASVEIDGNIDCKLKGNYSSIDIINSSSSVWADTEVPADVRIQGGSIIRLGGNYKSIEIESQNSAPIEIKSDSLCKAQIKQYSGELKLNGAFEELMIEGEAAEIAANLSVVPKRINLLDSPSTFNLMLPSDTPGMDITYKTNGNEEAINIISDFMLQTAVQGENSKRYLFGDKSCKIYIEAYQALDLQVLSNGYRSRK